MSSNNQFVVLTAVDRCDRCPARALVVLGFRSGPLQFCGHHTHRHLAAALAQGGAVVHDAREPELALVAAGDRH